MPEETMRVVTQTEGGTVTIAPEGDVDLARSPTLRAALRQALAAKPQRLVVDLTGVDYMDSSGVATLVEALQTARRGSTRLVLCAMKERVRSIFEIARLDGVFTIVDSREKAATA
ncbi:MAG: STAS domain-containing protein [Phycisphaerales bacterium]